MKKLKIFMLMTVLSVVLCACGGKEAEPSGDVVSDKDTVVEQKVEDVKEEKPVVEDKKDKESEHFECLPELLDAEPSERLMQYKNIVFKRDGSMSLMDVLNALQEDSEVYKLYTEDYIVGTKEEISMDGMINAGGNKGVVVAKEDGSGLLLAITNTSDSMVNYDDDTVKVFTFIPITKADVYFCKGIPLYGDGLTMDSVKELMKDYEDGLVVDEYKDSYRLMYSYEWTDAQGQPQQGSLSFVFDLNTGKCNGVDDL